jgi:hypothetical protein
MSQRVLEVVEMLGDTFVNVTHVPEWNGIRPEDIPEGCTRIVGGPTRVVLRAVPAPESLGVPPMPKKSRKLLAFVVASAVAHVLIWVALLYVPPDPRPIKVDLGDPPSVVVARVALP